MPRFTGYSRKYMNYHAKDILKRYGIATLGLILIALGVALSLKSNLGTAPVSCPPAMLNLRWGALSVGTMTWIIHLVFIATQMILRRKVLDKGYLLQLLAAFVFGFFCDAAIWLCQGIPAPNYVSRVGLILVSILLTAIGIRMEVVADTWILAGDKLTDVLADVSGLRFSDVKIAFDVFLVLLCAAFSWVCFRHLTGDGTHVVIREGTLLLAVLTGLCMKLTDPLVDRFFRPAHGE